MTPPQSRKEQENRSGRNGAADPDVLLVDAGQAPAGAPGRDRAECVSMRTSEA